MPDLLLQGFHPIIQQWFAERYGEPTDIQSLAWPRIAAGEHLLITAPTGSGKTLTAFLSAINRFATGELATGTTRVLYISPLKALNNDIRRNLIEPLQEIRERFAAKGTELPELRVMTRSGDTEQSARQRMLRRPPEILITTPESLNILLSSAGGRSLLTDLDTLIIDEVHSVVDSKRGSYLMSAVERLVRLSGEFQRIALSATVNPLETVAAFIGGYQRLNTDAADAAIYRQRQVNALVSRTHKDYDIRIRYPALAASRGEDEQIWDYLAADMLPGIQANRSTLVFVNSRALCEKLTLKLNAAAGRIVAYAHHGSLSREIRADVEQRLKNGELDAIVATSSLEMGIDIGALDEVILVQTPGSIASTIQRIGRAGHQVGAASRCTIYPTHPMDFLEAAVLATAVKARALEPVHIIARPLDVLAQVMISMTGTETWNLDELFAELRCSTTYHQLSRTEFDLVVNMLQGRYADHHIRELRPRVRIDGTHNSIEARKGSLLSLYMSGGVIPDRGYYQLRHEQDNARIGELDEEFVWEARVGQVFSMGTQNWQVAKITHNDVIVRPAKSTSTAPPFWKAEAIDRSFHYSERIGQFLETANGSLEAPAFRDRLITEHHAEPEVAEEMINFLMRQHADSGADLPHRHHLLFERIQAGPGNSPGHQLVVHTGWGTRVNRPFAMALEAAWQQRFGEQPEIHVANEAIVMQLPDPVRADELLAMVPIENIEKLLHLRLEGSGFFGARFRENAGRALLLSKGRFNERKPLWMSRLQSQRLLESVLKYEDFPILLETWRNCLQDEFDLPNLRRMLAELATGEIAVTEVETTKPSPFAQSIAWDQINTYMYMTDTPKSSKQSGLREDLLREVVWSPELRPGLRADIVTSFVSQRQRLAPGYQPADNIELEDWLKERSFIPLPEWQALLATLSFEPATDRAVNLHQQVVAARDDADRIERLLFGPNSDPAELEVLISNWLQYYGPMTDLTIMALLQTDNLGPILSSLCDAESLVEGALIESDETHYYCDALNYDFLLRQQRASHRLQVTAQPLETLPAFCFNWQTQFEGRDPGDQLFETLERLRGYPATAALWEAEILPARHRNYRPADLDALFSEAAVQWFGTGEQQVTFAFLGDEVLFLEQTDVTSHLIGEDLARYDFAALSDKSGLSAHELADRLWAEVWAGQIANDGMAALRTGIKSGFQVPETSPGNPATGRRSRRAAFNRWRIATPFSGTWRRLQRLEDEPDPIERQEMDKERVRCLLDRYGIVFRELCQREVEPLQWRHLFRALRLMELGGEVVSGHFFSGLTGPQFMTAASLRVFQKTRDDQSFFINATDPISPSGLGLGIHGDRLPRRIASNYLVYQGANLVMTAGKRGRTLQIKLEPDAEGLAPCFDVLHHLCYRATDPVRQLTIETINGKDAATSPYRASLETVFNVYSDYRSIVIQREL